jgi:hypothetical protein
MLSSGCSTCLSYEECVYCMDPYSSLTCSTQRSCNASSVNRFIQNCPAINFVTPNVIEAQGETIDVAGYFPAGLNYRCQFDINNKTYNTSGVVNEANVVSCSSPAVNLTTGPQTGTVRVLYNNDVITPTSSLIIYGTFWCVVVLINCRLSSSLCWLRSVLIIFVSILWMVSSYRVLYI